MAGAHPHRDRLGHYHQASATGRTKTLAQDRLRTKLEKPIGSLSSATTVGELCQGWLDRVVKESQAYWSLPDAATLGGAKPPRPQSLLHSVR